MPLIDMVKPLKANTIAIERTSPLLLGAGVCSWSPREAPATLAAELASGSAAEATTNPRAQATHAVHVVQHRPPPQTHPELATAANQTPPALCYRNNNIPLISASRARIVKYAPRFRSSFRMR